ncbi:long-chain fatty acid--CoA ligase [Cellulomonas sp. KRMCY2]|uniref:AMP-dependent synthetase/ligase n=1 Tax=Cellulomonas sp. KRMCY2 TaxID=1304865 RepID=UPI00045E7EB9|nr:AMP-dependent synthetase/ligase [Cellulomonas sp. KRMCY2]
MDVFTRPAHVEPDPTWSINTMLDHRVAKDPDRTLVEIEESGGWRAMSGTQFVAEVGAVAKGLMAAGIRAGDSVAIMAGTSYEWMLVDFAIWAAGAVGVPIYESSSIEQVQWICSDAGVRAVFVGQQEHADLVDEMHAELPRLEHVWRIDAAGLAGLRSAGQGVPDADLAVRRDAVRLTDLATIIYTSGTTGRPKGVELTHECFVFISANVGFEMAPACARPESRHLVFLPLAHVFARLIQVLMVGNGAVIGHCPNQARLIEVLQAFRPTAIVAVPRVFEKVYGGAELKAGGGLTLRIFRWSARVAIDHSRARDTAHGPAWPLRVQHALADRLVYRAIHRSLGGELRYSFSAGAPLGERLGHFFRGIGLTIVEGYGLTETTAPTTCNLIEANRIGTVGPVTAGTAARIAPDGEIQVKGPHVFRGYHNDPEATAEAFVDGWFRTGDIGAFDEDGYLRITGRIKELIVTASGKNVSPAILEDRLRGHPLVSQCVLVGDHRPFIAMLIALDAETLPGWLAHHGRPPMSVDEARTDAFVLAALQRAVDRTNEAVSRSESIRKFAVLDVDLTLANGYLTPSFKVRRDVVLADFAEQIDRLYQDERAAPTPSA